MLGRNLGDEEITHFVSEFRAAEQAFARRQYAAQTDTTGGTYELTRPSLGGQAQEFVEGGHPAEAGGNRMADYVAAIEQLVGG